MGFNMAVDDTQKECTTCKITKDVSLFHKCTKAKDGKAYVCKKCKSEYDKRPDQRARRDNYDKSPQGLNAHNKAKLKWRNNNTIKQQALNMVKNAVKSGEVIKLTYCESCQTVGRVEGHHYDYAKPLDVEWLCSQCHRDWHCKHGEALNADLIC